MSAPPPPPPSYNESMQQGGNYPAGGVGYGQSYGAVSGQPAGAYPQGYPAGGDYNQPGKAPGPYPPQAGYPPPAGAVPSYHHSQTNVVMQHPTQSVVLVGGCPACRVGVLEDDFTCCGVFLAIFFFPIGILCCLAMRQRRCANCGAVFG